MLRYDPRQLTEIISVGTTLPMTPTWAVYYDFENSKLITKQVICFSVREHLDKRSEIATEIKLYPIVLDKNTGSMVEESGDTVGYLGLSDEAEPKVGQWQEKLRDIKKRMKVEKGKSESDPE